MAVDGVALVGGSASGAAVIASDSARKHIRETIIALSSRMRIRDILTTAGVIVIAGAGAAAAQNPAAIEHHLRFGVRIADQPDTALDLLDHDPGDKRSIPIAPVGGDKFVGLEGGGEWTFERAADASGAVKSLALGAGANRRVFVRQPSPPT
jgi:hypothetical protein